MAHYPTSNQNLDPTYSYETQSQGHSNLNRTAAGFTTTAAASGFSGGYEIEGKPGAGALGGRPVSIINADDFVIEHPEFVTFYKDRKKVGLRHLAEISSIRSR